MEKCKLVFGNQIKSAVVLKERLWYSLMTGSLIFPALVFLKIALVIWGLKATVIKTVW